MKIKKFNINLRKSRIYRDLKQKIDVTQEIEEAVEKNIEEVKNIIFPASIFKTFSFKELDKEIIDRINISKNTLAVTFSGVTIGFEIEEKIKESEIKKENIKKLILESISKEALEQSSNFIYKIIEEEAKKDNCEISIKAEIPLELRGILRSILELEKVNIKIEENKVFPKYTIFEYFVWKPKKR